MQAKATEPATNSAAGMTTPIVGAGIIRPMSLAPPNPSPSVSQTLSPMDASGGSGGSGGSTGPPLVTVSGGGGVGGGGTGDFYIGNVPVGTSIGCLVAAPPGLIIDDTTISWSGGTGFSSYLSGSAEDAAPQSMQVGTNVVTNGTSYSFVLDASSSSDSVKVSVEYQGHPGDAQTTTAHFTAVAPATANLSLVSTGSPRIDLANGPNLILDNPGKPDDAGIRIQAMTDGGQFEFDYMFLQTTNTLRSATTQADGILHTTERCIKNWLFSKACG